jgi:uncharacterized protein YjiS (DUF1127 family)
MTQTQSPKRTAPVLVGASLSFLPLLDLLAEALRRRRIRRSYGPMSDAQLRDIGLTPYELEVALSLPLERNASDHLAAAAATEAAKW